MFDAADLIADGLEQGKQRGVDENHLVFGVVDDVGQLIGRQAEVQGMHDGAVAGNGEVQLQMAVAVPAQRADAITRLDA